MKKNTIRCYLWENVDHSNIKEKYRKLIVVGRLFDSRPICIHCYLHLNDICQTTLTDNDYLDMQQRRKRFPKYAKIADSLTEEAKDELLHRTVLDFQPCSLPTRPEEVETYPKTEVLVNPKGWWFKER